MPVNNTHVKQFTEKKCRDSSAYSRCSVLSGILGFLLKICFFLLGSNFRNMCFITVFSIQEYSSFTGIMCKSLASGSTVE